jgi:MFS family permease
VPGGGCAGDPHRPEARPGWWPAALAWSLWALGMLGLAAVPWMDRLLRQAGRADLVQLTPGTIWPALAMVSGATVGAVLASRRPRHPVGWLLLALALSLTTTAAAAQYLTWGLLVRPGSLPAARLVALHYPATGYAALTVIGFLLLLTPTGKLPSPGWRWWARVMAAAPVVLVLVATLAGGPLDPRYQALGGPFDLRGHGGALLIANQLALAVTTLSVVVAAGSLVGRFRRARGLERLQLRWVALAAVMVVLAGVVVLAGLVIGVPGATVLPSAAVGICLMVLPMATGAAILRYRLYDLDRIISRTLAYGLLTLLLAGGYAVVALGLGQLLGRDSSLAVAGATLAVAAVFQPARRRIQEAVDRRFNRRRHDAAQTIAAFSTRLRDQVDLATLTAEVLAVVNQTMQPTRASLWLRPQHQPKPTGVMTPLEPTPRP